MPLRPGQSLMVHSLYRRAAGRKPELPFGSHRLMDDRSSFETKADAQAWVRVIQSEIDRGIFASRVEAEYFLDRLVWYMKNTQVATVQVERMTFFCEPPRIVSSFLG